MTNDNDNATDSDWLERQKEYYSQLDSSLLPQESVWQSYIVDQFSAYAQLNPAENGLEIGAGMGRYSVPLMQQGLHMDLSELSAFQVAELHTQLEKHDLSLPAGNEIITASLEDMAEKTDTTTYDYVIGFNVLHHIPQQESAFPAMLKLLRPGGKIVFQEPNPLNILHYIQAAVDPRRRFNEELGMLKCTRGQFLKRLAEYGFINIEIEYYGFFPPFIVNLPGGIAVEKLLNRINFIPPTFAYMLIRAFKPE